MKKPLKNLIISIPIIGKPSLRFYHLFRKVTSVEKFKEEKIILEFINHLNLKSDDRILDIGCGFSLSAMRLSKGD